MGWVALGCEGSRWGSRQPEYRVGRLGYAGGRVGGQEESERGGWGGRVDGYDGGRGAVTVVVWTGPAGDGMGQLGAGGLLEPVRTCVICPVDQWSSEGQNYRTKRADGKEGGGKRT